MAAFKNKKHVVVLNAELDATLGPILKREGAARWARSVLRRPTATSRRSS